MDVLCGSKNSNGPTGHFGNRLFRRVIASFAKEFDQCKTKRDRSWVIDQIIVTMQQKHGSRFLRRQCDNRNGENGNDHWVELETQAIRDKVSHALRFCSSSQKQTPAQRRKASSPMHKLAPSKSEQQHLEKTADSVSQIYQRQQVILKTMLDDDDDDTNASMQSVWSDTFA